MLPPDDQGRQDEPKRRQDQDGEVETTFTIDPSKEPKTIDVRVKKGADAGKIMLGIYAIDGDSLKMCMNQPNLERPKEFATKAEARIGLIIMKRGKP